jgi:hypothetical protein
VDLKPIRGIAEQPGTIRRCIDANLNLLGGKGMRVHAVGKLTDVVVWDAVGYEAATAPRTDISTLLSWAEAE